MRYKHKPRQTLQEGDKRIRKGFLFFPKTLLKENGVFETRWLETAEWVEYRTLTYPSRWLEYKWHNFNKEKKDEN